MSTIKSSTEHLTLNADGSGKDIKFQANGVEVASISSTGNLTSTGIDDNATSTAITIDASENVGIGVTPETWTVFKVLQLGGESVIRANTASNEDFAVGRNMYYDGSWKRINTAHAQEYLQDNSGKHLFRVAASGSADSAITWTTAMTIDNTGNVNTGSSTATQGTLNAKGYEKKACDFRRYNSTGEVVHFEYNDGTVGSISVTGSNTAYNTSSDYRLKELDVPMEGSIDRLKLLRPINFAWKADGSRVDGFFAHEAQEVVPEAVTGTKDAMMDEEYEVTPAVMDGETVVTEAVMGTRSVPDYQGIDQSKLVPLLVASLQEAVAKIEALEARVTALEV